MNLEELDLYGSSRLGVKQVSQQMSALSFTSETGNNYRVLGLKQYELSNHLGNVLSVISDQKLPQFNAGTLQAYKPVIVSSQDYYPFGMVMKERSSNLASDGYRFGFNNQERTDEISGAGNHTTALFWEYDTRIGRRWNLDPKPTISQSQYSCFFGNPIWNVDKFGDTTYNFNGKTGQYIGMTNLKEKGSHGLIIGFKPNIGEPKNVSLNVPFEFADPTNDSKAIRENDITNLVLASQDKIEEDVEEGTDGHEWYNQGSIMGSRYLWKNSNGGKTDYVVNSTFHGPKPENSLSQGLRSNTLYLTLVDDKFVAHNNFNYGNFLWGASAAALKVPESIAKAGAHYNNYKNDPYSKGQWDSVDDQYSIHLGYTYWKNKK